MNAVKGVIFIALAYIAIWFQAYGPSKVEWVAANRWVIYVLAIPVTFVFTLGTETLLPYFKDSVWALRFISFAINMFVFTIMTRFIADELLTLKSATCLTLALAIILIQILWK
jgi:hypothetical protein